jgi:Trk-type K+ transport system membrane component
MSLVIFILVLLASIVVVTIGAVLFELTGMHWRQAKFQAISCFTSTGFTTKEAELVMVNQRRRRIASALMILGNAGFITLFATLVNSFAGDLKFLKRQLPIVDKILPESLWPLANLLVLLLIGYLLYKGLSHTKISNLYVNFIKRRVEKQKSVKKVTFEEVVLATGGYGTLGINIKTNSHLAGKTIKQNKLSTDKIKVLAIERNQESLAFPNESEKLEIGDKIICFGNLIELKERLDIKNQT